MGLDEKTIREGLKGRRVLIIEDDPDLAHRLIDLFGFWSVKADDIAHRRCVKGALHGALDLLNDSGDSFDLMCVDVMLPWDEERLKASDDLQRQWNELQEKITLLRDYRATEDDEIGELRNEIGTLSEQMQATIDRKAGLRMIVEWCKGMKERFGDAWVPHTAILFLTARQAPSLAAEITEIKDYLGDHPNMKWITKPALESQVVTAAGELLANRPKRRTKL